MHYPAVPDDPIFLSILLSITNHRYIMIDLGGIERSSEDSSAVRHQFISDCDGAGDGSMVEDLSHHVELLLLRSLPLHLTILVNIVGVVVLGPVAPSLRPACLTPAHPDNNHHHLGPQYHPHLEQGIPLSCPRAT